MKDAIVQMPAAALACGLFAQSGYCLNLSGRPSPLVVREHTVRPGFGMTCHCEWYVSTIRLILMIGIVSIVKKPLNERWQCKQRSHMKHAVIDLILEFHHLECIQIANIDRRNSKA